MAFFSAHQIHFAVIAWSVIVLRLVTRRFTKNEYLLLFLFLGLVLVELLQLGVSFHDMLLLNLTPSQKQGFPRYFNPMAPLLWAWAAWGIADLWRLKKRAIRLIARISIVCVGIYFMFGMVVPHFRAIQRFGDGVDAIVAAKRIAPAIRRDYAGPKLRESFKYSEHEYFTAKRPVIFSDFGAAAWFAQGQSMGANLGYYPHNEDYLFLCMKSGVNRGMNGVNPDDYDYVAQVLGLKNRWMLFRRKGIPHR